VSAPTVAIATGILGAATETGVRRHIATLFGGRTVVLAERREPGFQPTRPSFIQYEVGGPLIGAERLIGNGVQSLRYACSGVPFGRRRGALETFLRTHDVRAILAEFGHIGANMAPVGQALGIPVFVYFRGFDASKRLRERKIVRRYRAAMPRLSGVIAVSQFLLDNLAAHGITHPVTAVIPTGVDTRLFTPGEKDPGLVLAVGRLVAKKAPLLVIDAFAAAARDLPGHRLEVIGGGDLRGACEERVRALGLSDRVVFHGVRDHAFVRERLARAAVFVQHSVTDAEGNAEGLPTAVQEAMACGAAVVSTRHAGIPEAVQPGVTGLLVEEHDAEGFAMAIRALLTDPEMVARLGTQARAVAEERFDYRRLHARLEEMIRDECTRLGRPAPAASAS
jgi:glycosyltransferase involved in cell wall biosynthesis